MAISEQIAPFFKFSLRSCRKQKLERQRNMESRSLEYKFTRQLFKNLQKTEMSYCQAPSPNIADNYI